jgi:mannose-6-phosphate isomerase-like protein (cupin superfamily)
VTAESSSPVPQTQPHNINAVLSGVAEHWSPRTIEVVNDYDVRVVKVYGDFTAHRHPDTDEFFLVLSGRLTIKMDDGNVTLGQGDTFVVHRGQVHQPCADVETSVLLFEPSRTVNTGDTPSPLTAQRTVVGPHDAV